MAISKVESFVFGGPCAHFVTSFDFADGVVTIPFRPIEGNRQDCAAFVVATFVDAVVTSIWNDAEETLEFPLDPIGFDSESSGERWRFNLFCGSVEWNWESAWPSLSFPTQP
jgi:hypothetical protein